MNATDANVTWTVVVAPRDRTADCVGDGDRRDHDLLLEIAGDAGAAQRREPGDR